MKMDSTDAKSTESEISAEVHHQNGEAVRQAICPVERDAPDYNMQHRRRGKAYIFNQEDFDDSLKLTKRDGSSNDVSNLDKAFSSLGFEVLCFTNSDITRVRKAIKQLAEEDHTDNDCVMVVVLSHGENGQIYASDSLYHPEELWQPFTSEKCPSLAGKPKLFIFQACQGDQKDLGTRMQFDASSRDSVPYEYSIPTLADFMTAYSTIPGYVSWRNTQNGTWFIEAICEVLNERGSQDDLLSMMTLVLQKVATRDGVYSQIPSVVSQLIRRICFPPKQ